MGERAIVHARGLARCLNSRAARCVYETAVHNGNALVTWAAGAQVALLPPSHPIPALTRTKRGPGHRVCGDNPVTRYGDTPHVFITF